MKPRLSGYLRLFIKDEPEGPLDVPAPGPDLGPSWPEITEICAQDLHQQLFKLVDCARTIAGKHSNPAQIEEYAALLFRTFSNDSSHRERVMELKSVFGSVSDQDINQVRLIVEEICKGMKEYGLTFSNGHCFGDSIVFNDENRSEQFSDVETSDDEDIELMNGAVGGAVNGLTEFSLRDSVEVFFSPSEADDWCSTIISCRKSSKDEHEFQAALFDLLGVEKIDLIQILVQNMDEINEKSVKCRPCRITKAAPAQKPSMPSYGTQVTVMSEKEKSLQKEIRRMDKKRTKNGPEVEMNGLDFHMMRQEREYQLATAASRPLLRDPAPMARPQYPYVFDEYAETRSTSAFLGGCKVSLPETAERHQDSIRELVHLPALPRDSVPHIRDLVKVEDMDDICQIAFKNTKSLNRIQSIVYDAAYKTNENLLICAPTGAGKTNVAMLTILREIRNHLQQGVIRKDDFKIVYVAPMKALAAEMVRNFGKRLNPLGINVRELTGDMNLTKTEIKMTQMLVTTPEKWDVVTRKSTGDVSLTQLVSLLIIDEVHLLHDDRGAVLETLVARTLRQVEAGQKMIRIIGLSATLPNYVDVAGFLRVNPFRGLFFFDDRFRPVPLTQTFIGVKGHNISIRISNMNRVCYDEMIRFIKRGDQVMIFVHARNETLRTCKVMREMAKNLGDITLFWPDSGAKVGEALKEIGQSRHRELSELMAEGFAVHHAGMLRQDRNMVERQFANGFIRVLVCTATLAWGVNLPARGVIIKGTDVYDAKHGCLVDLGILDVLQIFGRAGRPQFDKHGDGIIITTHDRLSHYLSLVTRRNAIESQFLTSLKDNLNAEIALGTVTNIDEAVKWLSYTYLFVRMRLNPLVYGMKYDEVQKDPDLQIHRAKVAREAAQALDKARMIRFDAKTGYLYSTDLGRVASHFYINYETVEMFNENLNSVMTEAQIFDMVALAQEFTQIKVREEEMDELDDHLLHCRLPVKGGVENPHGKVNILLQSYISKFPVESFSLNSDTAYIAQNAGRIMRSLFEIAMTRKWPIVTAKFLELSKSMDKRLWPDEHPIKQFSSLSYELLRKIESKNLSMDKLRELSSSDIGHWVHHVKKGGEIKALVNSLPLVSLEVEIQPITRTVLRMQVRIEAEFVWNDRIHGMTSEQYWLWVEDPDTNNMYHSESVLISKAQVVKQEKVCVTFTIPISEPFPNQYHVKMVSDRWLGVQSVYPVSFKHLILPELHPPHTELLDLQPLPITALQDPRLELLFKFTHFNPVQTQIFHTLYHTDQNVLLGAPTGSGKTIAAELAIFRLMREYPGKKAVYIAPLKALVRERMDDWKIRIGGHLNRSVIELTGDVTPDVRAIDKADLIVTTPEKWDGISRSWQNRAYVQDVQLIVIDEIHLLGADRGPVLEVIVSRTNYISSHTSHKVRIVGLSTALANAHDLSDWLGIKDFGLYNFRPSVRPVPLQTHISGFPGKHYCPRMATMNKPCFQAIRLYSPEKPALIFVSSRRQTRLTALDLISLLASEPNPKQWLHLDEKDMMSICNGIQDTNLRLTLAFGVGIHHAGLTASDRKTVEELFVNQKIQVLIATSTLAWGVNFPARLVVVKGTEYYDGKLNRYVDFPITDVLQMMGRAGRPQFDDEGVAVIMVHDIKKNFYKRFLYEPFPVESSLLGCLTDHLNAEVVAGTVTSKQDAIDYVTWTYFFRRLLVNPSFYHLEEITHECINRYLSALVEKSVRDLVEAGCVTDEDGVNLQAETLGRLASYYYLSHRTVRTFHDRIKATSSIPDLMEILADAEEYNELPVRHNEDQQNLELSKLVPLETDERSMDSAHTKAFLLLQAHLSRAELPCSDYLTDTKSVLDQAIRILQAMLDVAADAGWLLTSLRIIHLLQMVIQGHWLHEPDIITLPHVESYHCLSLQKELLPRSTLTLLKLIEFAERSPEKIRNVLKEDLKNVQCDEIVNTLKDLPQIDVRVCVSGWWEGGEVVEKRTLTMDSEGRSSATGWLELHADQEYQIQIDVRRNRRKTAQYVHTPRFPKPKDEGWFLVMGEGNQRELVAMKRVGGISRRSTLSLSFLTPEHEGRVVYGLYLMSDSYVGLDQQFQLYFQIIPASIEAQLNTEMAE